MCDWASGICLEGFHRHIPVVACRNVTYNWHYPFHPTTNHRLQLNTYSWMTPVEWVCHSHGTKCGSSTCIDINIVQVIQFILYHVVNTWLPVSRSAYSLTICSISKSDHQSLFVSKSIFLTRTCQDHKQKTKVSSPTFSEAESYNWSLDSICYFSRVIGKTYFLSQRFTLWYWGKGCNYASCC